MASFAILGSPGVLFSHSQGLAEPDRNPLSPASKASDVTFAAGEQKAYARTHTLPGGGVNNIYLFGYFIGPDSVRLLRCGEGAALKLSPPPEGIGRPVSLTRGGFLRLPPEARSRLELTLSGAKHFFYETFEDGYYRRGA